MKSQWRESGGRRGDPVPSFFVARFIPGSLDSFMRKLSWRFHCPLIWLGYIGNATVESPLFEILGLEATNMKKWLLGGGIFGAFVLSMLLVSLVKSHAVQDFVASMLPQGTPDNYIPAEQVHLPSVGSSNVTRFAVIGDYGSGSREERDVADLVKSWNPDFVITTGDNNYRKGEVKTIDQNIGQFYSGFICPYYGKYSVSGQCTVNRFFPTLGNHDWQTRNAQPYLDYFTLPGNERYFEFTSGAVHFFAVDSDVHEPDGITRNSVQAAWLRDRLATSTSTWKIVYMHHPPFSSGEHGSSPKLQWPYKEWGATAVLAGHDHTYERILRDGFPYFVNGLGGRSRYEFVKVVSGSQVRYNADYGAMLVEADNAHIVFKFYNRSGLLIDVYTLSADSG